MSLQSVRGTQDLLPELQAKHNMVIEIAKTLSQRFGFAEMSTPIFEFSDVFKRTLGEASDIVNKEMYTFQDRNGEELTLRPEGTAGIARSFISEGLSQRTPFKVFYQGPMFRYERPQKGRYRQFHQFGVELLGTSSPFADLECLALGHEIVKALEVSESSRLEINSIGNEPSRKAYTAALVEFLKSRESELSADSQRRLTVNPLRILDSKDEKDRALLTDAPQISDFYDDESRSMFHAITDGLSKLKIPFEINPRLVRGLDYYSHTVFEFKTSALGAQDAILSGGRYDGLVKQMGGPATPAVGWAAGIERLAMLSPLSARAESAIAIIPVHGSVEAEAHKICYDLRKSGLTADIGFSGNLSKRMKRASDRGAWAAVILGPDELSKGEVQVKKLATGEQKMIPLADLETALKRDK